MMYNNPVKDQKQNSGKIKFLGDAIKLVIEPGALHKNKASQTTCGHNQSYSFYSHGTISNKDAVLDNAIFRL